MNTLSKAERELVALGTALGSNCVPCIEYHIPQALEAGLSDRQIGEAIRLADQVRQVPARKVLAAAVAMLTDAPAETRAEGGGASCGQPVPEDGAGEEQSVPEAGAEEPCCA